MGGPQRRRGGGHRARATQLRRQRFLDPRLRLHVHILLLLPNIRQHPSEQQAYHRQDRPERHRIHTERNPPPGEQPHIPAELHRKIEAWCFANAADERKEGQTDTQFVYTTRKKALGPFKRTLWELPVKGQILADQGAKVAFLFDQLKVTGTRALLERYVPNGPEWHRPLPEALRAAMAG